MSTILKALRRLEEEKSRGGTSRPLREEVASGPRDTPRRRVPWFPVLAMVIGLGLGASAWWVWPYERGGEPVREASSGTPAAAAPAPDPAAAVTLPEDTHVTRRVPPGFNAAAAQVEQQLAQFADGGLAEQELQPGGPPSPPDDAFASNVEVVDRPLPTPRIEPVAPGSQPARVIADAPQVAVEPPAAIARRPKRQRGPAQPAPRIAAAQLAEPVSAADPVTAPAASPQPAPQLAAPAPPQPAPQMRESAPQMDETEPPVRETAPKASAPAPARVAKKSVPAAVSDLSAEASAVRVKRTQWHPEPGRRSADLDVSGRSQSVREGDVVGEFVVTEIRPSGVVLTRDGERIERGIGK